MPVDPRLDRARALMLDWQALRGRLESLGYPHAAQFIGSCTARIAAQLHARWWPPVWWRFMSVDADFSALSTYFFRMDSEGMFYGDGPDGYRPEREEVLARVEQLQAADAERRKLKHRMKRQHAPVDI